MSSLPVLITRKLDRYIAVEHLQSGCLIGVFRCLPDAQAYSHMIRPWLKGVTCYDDISDRFKRALAIQLRGWYTLYNYPPYTHCPICNQWAILCKGHKQ